MKHLRLSIVLAFSIALLGCSTNGLHPEQTAVPWKQLAEEWRPYTNQISSPVQLTAVLESRWPLVSILPACKAIGPFPKGGQNLVTVGQNTWEGVLHKGKRKTTNLISTPSTWSRVIGSGFLRLVINNGCASSLGFLERRRGSKLLSRCRVQSFWRNRDSAGERSGNNLLR